MMKKRTLGVLLALVMVLSLVPSMAFATEIVDSGIDCDNLTWALDSDGVLTISGTGKMWDYGHIGVAGGYITRAPWDDYITQIKSVIICDGVTNIGLSAFEGCNNLIGATVGNSVTSISPNAFTNCSSLKMVAIGNSVTSIGAEAFWGCSNLTDISIPSAVTSIGNYAFYDCDSLTSITIPDNVMSIGDHAFVECGGLESVTISDSVTTIGDYAFYGCSVLSDVYYNGTQTQWNDISVGNYNDSLISATLHFAEIPAAVVASGECGADGDNLTWTLDDAGILTVSGIGAMANYNSSETNIYNGYAPWHNFISIIEEVRIGNDVTYIGSGAFWNCSGIESVTIPESVTSIGGSAFCSCNNLANVKISDNVTSIGYRAFHNTPWIKSFGDFATVNGILLEYCGEATSVIIPDNVTSIGAGVFQYCDNLTYVKLPEELRSISGSAFYGCRNLTSVTIPDSVTSIGERAFCYCHSLENVIIPDAVTSIGERAFCDCSNLTSVTIGENVTSIGNYAFYDCTDLTEIHYNAKAAEDMTSASNAFQYIGTKSDGITVIFGNRVKKIPAYLFYGYAANITALFFTGNAPTNGSNALNYIYPIAYYPYDNDTWTGDALQNLTFNGNITWKPYSNAEAVSAECTMQKDSYAVGDVLELSSIIMNITRFDGCIEEWDYSSGEIQLGSYDMNKAGWQAIDVTCRGASTKLNIYVHDKQVKTMDVKDYPESTHNYENNLDKTYTYTVQNGHSMEVTFSEKTAVETNVDYIYVNGTKYTGTALAGTTISIDGDTLIIRLVTDSSDNDYGFSINQIVATTVVHEYTISNMVAPTCTEQGYIAHTCACGESYKDNYVDAMGHDFGTWTITTNPTCTEKGEETRYCSRCDATEKCEVETTGHQYTTKIIAPTCTAKGYTSHTCICGERYKDNYVDALGHDWDNGKVTTSATCTANGVKTYTCTVCHATKTETIKVAGHKYTAKVTAPTCTAKGYTTHTCSVCGNSYKDTYKDAKGHTTKVTTTKATLSANGKIVYTCSVCGKTTQSAKTIYMPKTFSLSYTKYTYNGKVKTPTVTVKDSKGNALKEGTDYTVTYATGRKAVGTYKVTIKGIGKYSFTKTLSFKVNPAATKIVSATNSGAGKITVKWNKAAGAGGYQVKYVKGTTTKTVKVSGASTLTKTLTKLTKDSTYKIYVRSYKTVGSTTYYSAYSAYKSVKVAK